MEGITRNLAAAFGMAALVGTLALPGTASAAGVDYSRAAKCANPEIGDGWASVRAVPGGTDRVEFTMRTGTPGAWNAVTVEATTRARQWRVVTGPGRSFINWVKFYGNGELLGAYMVNVRCEGTPLDWPA